MKQLKLAGLLSLVATLAASSYANAHSANECNFIPENTVHIPEGLEAVGGIDEATFNRVIDKVSKVYTPVIKSKGAELIVKRLWKKTDVFQGQNGDLANAFALQEGKKWYVAMFGGLARHSVTSEDGFTLVMCHEVGHHVAGYPKKKSFMGNDWASNEGQSDYFATMKCARQVWLREDNASVVASMKVPALVTKQCSVQHKSSDEIALCQRSAMAGLNLGTLLWSLSNSAKLAAKPNGLEAIAGAAQPGFSTPNKTQVSSTDDKHPEAQCRLDTYFNGAICGISYSEDFGLKDAATGACAQEKGDKIGFRPRCWYKPSSAI